MQSVSDFIAKHGVTMQCEPTTHNEFIEDSPTAPCFHYRLTIKCGDRSHAFTYSVGCGIVERFALAGDLSAGKHPCMELRALAREYGGSGKRAPFGNQWPPRNITDRGRYDGAMCRAARRYVPPLTDVLDCLADDCAGYENARCFEDFAREYGYDTDSRKAERIYRACGAQHQALESVFGRTVLHELMFETERE